MQDFDEWVEWKGSRHWFIRTSHFKPFDFIGDEMFLALKALYWQKARYGCKLAAAPI